MNLDYINTELIRYGKRLLKPFVRIRKATLRFPGTLVYYLFPFAITVGIDPGVPLKVSAIASFRCRRKAGMEMPAYAC